MMEPPESFLTCMCDHDFEEHDADLACQADGCVCALYEEDRYE